MKKLLIMLAFTLPQLSSAQKQANNSVKIHVGGFYNSASSDMVTFSYARGNFFNLGNQLGISYERRVFKKLFISGAYSKWVQLPEWGSPGPLNYRSGYSYSEPVDKPLDIVQNQWGETYIWHERSIMNMNMVDLSALYKYNVGSKHTITAGVGASYFWAQREDMYTTDYRDGGCVLYADQQFQNVAGLGVVPQISYDYSFLNNLLSVGVDARARYYTKRVGGQYDYGLHVGVNF